MQMSRNPHRQVLSLEHSVITSDAKG